VTGIHRSLWLLPLVLVAPGCRRAPSTYYDAATRQKVTRITLQTDWYAQAEHGGFYQAQAKGYYRDVGLDVTIDQGGPMVPVGLKIAIGVAQFGIGRGDETIVAVARGIPYVILSAMMQHDPQALLLHRENPVNSFRDLSGKTVMTVPGAKWITYIQKVYDIKFSIIPLNFGMAQFMADPNFIQQCFVTNEPYYVEKNGGHPKTILISDTGFDPYRVIMGNADFVAAHPRETRAFVEASLRGWEDYLHGDPTPANREISRLNLQMTPDFLAYAVAAMKRYKLVDGDPSKGEAIGLITRKRLQEQIDALRLIGVLDRVVTPDDVADFKDFAPR
jgi:NitT/TauT family transport system substrate-binding protein